MESKLTKEFTVLASHCDSTARLGVAQAFDLCMDLAAENAAALGNGIPVMMARGLFWVAVKTRIRFFRRPALMETITAATWPEEPGRMHDDRDYLLTRGTETLAAGRTEWTIVNTREGGLRSPRDNIYDPALEFCPDKVWTEPFHRFRGDFPDPPFAEYTVRSTDIDMGGHMNNAAYIRMLQSLYSGTDWTALDPREVEAHYRASCYEGDVLALQRRRADDGALEFRAALPDGKTVFLARLK